MPRRILVIGGGFAGLWAAAGAARALDAADVPPERVEIALVNPDPFHAIRVRCYEAALDPARVPLDAVLGPIGVRRIEGAASAIDAGRRAVTLHDGTVLAYDRLILAAGSQLWRPPVPGLAKHGFDVDTLAGAARLAAHIDTLGEPGEGAWSAIVIGGGLVGIEIACELRERLGAARAGLPGDTTAIRVLLLDHAAEPGAGMGAAALPAIRAAFAATGVTARGGARIAVVDEAGVTLEGGECIAARTVIAATGMRASPLAALLPESLARDRLGRLKVDGFLQVAALPGVFAAGDIACAAADDLGHETVMSCQHARPMGRIAGHNAACDLLGRAGDRVRFAAPDYVTILDLGSWGAVYTGGWDRAALVASGAEAKAVKQRINGQRIYPPPGGDRAAILEAAAPVIQAAPSKPATG